jgi:hypothetical protein
VGFDGVLMDKFMEHLNEGIGRCFFEEVIGGELKYFIGGWLG